MPQDFNTYLTKPKVQREIARQKARIESYWNEDKTQNPYLAELLTNFIMTQNYDKAFPGIYVAAELGNNTARYYMGAILGKTRPQLTKDGPFLENQELAEKYLIAGALDGHKICTKGLSELYLKNIDESIKTSAISLDPVMALEKLILSKWLLSNLILERDYNLEEYSRFATEEKNIAEFYAHISRYCTLIINYNEAASQGRNPLLRFHNIEHSFLQISSFLGNEEAQFEARATTHSDEFLENRKLHETNPVATAHNFMFIEPKSYNINPIIAKLQESKESKKSKGLNELAIQQTDASLCLALIHKYFLLSRDSSTTYKAVVQSIKKEKPGISEEEIKNKISGEASKAIMECVNIIVDNLYKSEALNNPYTQLFLAYLLETGIFSFRGKTPIAKIAQYTNDRTISKGQTELTEDQKTKLIDQLRSNGKKQCDTNEDYREYSTLFLYRYITYHELNPLLIGIGRSSDLKTNITHYYIHTPSEEEINNASYDPDVAAEALTALLISKALHDETASPELIQRYIKLKPAFLGTFSKKIIDSGKVEFTMISDMFSKVLKIPKDSMEPRDNLLLRHHLDTYHDMKNLNILMRDYLIKKGYDWAIELYNRHARNGILGTTITERIEEGKAAEPSAVGISEEVAESKSSETYSYMGGAGEATCLELSLISDYDRVASTLTVLLTPEETVEINAKKGRAAGCGGGERDDDDIPREDVATTSHEIAAPTPTEAAAKEIAAATIIGKWVKRLQTSRATTPSTTVSELH